MRTTVRASARQDVEKLLNRAMTLHRQGDFGRAESAYKKILAAEARHSGALTLLGTLYIQQDRQGEGLKLLNQSLAINPFQPTAYNSCGGAYKALKNYDKALACYAEACNLDPNFVEAWYNRGGVLRQLRRYEEALESYDKALALQPSSAKIYNNRANVYKELQRHDEALQGYEKALALSSGDARLQAHIHYNRGGAFADMRRHQDALADYNLAIALRPDYADALYAKSLLTIMLGQWEEGWKLYEWRWETDDMRATRRDFSQPLWLGKEDLKGKSILLYAEQGLGDAIRMWRYVPLVHALGAKIILEVREPLVELVASTGLEMEVVTRGAALPDFDFHCPLMSLPLAFATKVDTVPFSTPYFIVDPQREKQWRERLGEKTRPRIGVAWEGSGRYATGADSRRNVPFAEFRKLIDTDHDYFCLQKEISPADKDALAQESRVRTYEDALTNFAETAALIAEMDLVISVDTAVAHLAGALGKPVWVLMPDPPDFLSMEGREDSPWYPTVRLFRQTQPGEWSGIIARAAAELGKLA